MENKTTENGNRKALGSITRALDYIEEHFAEEISIDQLASQCYLSVFYFQRLFRAVTGHSVEKYIISRRLAHSSELLLAGEPIGQAALDCGFKNPEHYSRAFKEAYKLTPSEYKETRPPLVHTYKPDVLLANAELAIGDQYISENMLLEIKLQDQKEQKIVGSELFCPFGNQKPGIDNPGIAWEKFHPVKHKIPHQSQPPQEFGISYKHTEKGFYYLAGLRVDHLDNIPDGFTPFTLPEGLYLRCSFENESFEAAVGANMKSAMDYFQAWFEKNPYVPEQNFIAEYYSVDAFKEPYRVELWAPVKERKE